MREEDSLDVCCQSNFTIQTEIDCWTFTKILRFKLKLSETQSERKRFWFYLHEKSIKCLWDSIKNCRKYIKHVHLIGRRSFTAVKSPFLLWFEIKFGSNDEADSEDIANFTARRKENERTREQEQEK